MTDEKRFHDTARDDDLLKTHNRHVELAETVQFPIHNSQFMFSNTFVINALSKAACILLLRVI